MTHRSGKREHFPPLFGPEVLAVSVVVGNQNQRANDPGCFEGGKGLLNKFPPQTLAPMFWGDGQMIQEAAAAVVSGQHSSDQLPLEVGDKTHAWIAPEIAGQLSHTVALGQFHPFGFRPQLVRGQQIIFCHGPDLN